MTRWWILALCLACRLPPIDADPLIDIQRTTPKIESWSMVCEPERERWQLDVLASSWTGGGLLVWTIDGHYVEEHNVYSRKAAQDATFDELRLRLDIVADWRDAQKNSSTPFLCASAPTAQFVMYDVDGHPTDCFQDGPNTEWLSTSTTLEDCETAP